MAGMDYDGIAGVLRVLEAGQKPETFAIEVITFHAAIEHEIEIALRKIIPRPDALFTGTPKLGFAHKAKLLNALWQREGEDADTLAKVLHAFQNLRDAVAHSDRKEIKGCNTNLTVAYRAIAKNDSDDYPILEVAQGICLFMADGTTVDELKATFAALGKLVNEDMPRALGMNAR
jgi:hypothetical protein